MKRKQIKQKILLIFSICGGSIALITGFPYAWYEQERQNDSLEEVSSVEKQLKNLSDSKPESDFPSWEKIERITDSLIFPNNKIMQAKALLNYQENPLPKPMQPQDTSSFKDTSQRVV